LERRLALLVKESWIKGLPNRPRHADGFLMGAFFVKKRFWHARQKRAELPLFPR